MYSFFGSCKLNGINPWEWLSYVLSVIPNYKVSQLKDLLPSNYKKQS
ncbi:MAG: transposase domain-containing protein [Candidatus Cloacimonetes bacterium]|nr:transposase domain-containing protein [Candidatus Cloacimonadota bacterium]